MIDLKKEKLTRLWPDSAQLFPETRKGKLPGKSTLYRRINDPDNPLEVCKCGGSLFTTEEAVHRWIERETERVGRVNQSQPETPAHRHVRQESAKRRLAAHGIVYDANSDRSSE